MREKFMQKLRRRDDISKENIFLFSITQDGTAPHNSKQVTDDQLMSDFANRKLISRKAGVTQPTKSL